MSTNSNSKQIFDLDDIPRVAASDLYTAVERMVAAGQADLLLGERTDSERRVFEEYFWEQFSGNTRLGTAILVRLWALADVLTLRRLQKMLHDEGFLFLRRVAEVAASQRLNAHRGLNPQQMIWSLHALDRDMMQTRLPRTQVPVQQRRRQDFALAA